MKQKYNTRVRCIMFYIKSQIVEITGENTSNEWRKTGTRRWSFVTALYE
jgi:hypothetical protein